MKPIFSPTQSSRGELFLAVAGLLWLLWMFGALSQSFTRSLSVFLFDLLGAVILILLSRNLPSVLRITVMGLGVALLFISVGDGNLSAALITNIDPADWVAWRRPFQYFGSVLVIVFTTALPFALARQRLYIRTQPLLVMLSGLGAAGVLTGGLMVFEHIELFQMIFFFAACYVATIFTFQYFILKDNKLARIFRQLAVVFILASLGRLALIILGGSVLGDVIYDLFWCAGISAASWTLIVRQQ